MNAKKIMGAVLVAFLAAALFIGAGAAAEGKDFGTVFVFQEVTSDMQGNWVNGAVTVTVTANNVVVPGDNFVPGTYKKGNDVVYITYPTASYAATAKYENTYYLVANGGKVFAGSDLQVVVTSLNTSVTTSNVLYTDANGISEKKANPFASLAPVGTKGTYKIQAVFDGAGLVQGVPFDLLLDTLNSFSFTVVEAGDATISAEVDTAYEGEVVAFTVEGTPGEEYKVIIDGFTIPANQLLGISGSGNTYTFEMPNTGKATFGAQVADEKEATLTLWFDNAAVKNGEITIKVASPVVTATLGAASYYIGDEVEMTGTSTSDVALKFFIEGTNFKKTELIIGTDVEDYVAGKTWEATIITDGLADSEGKKIDVGTYSITLQQGGKTVATIPVALKQPFIQLTSAPEVVAQGTAAKFIGTAEATDKVYYYIFGTNFYTAKKVGSADFDKNQFTFEIAKEDTNNMSAGQYFVVVQHPMYDGDFNIALNTTSGAVLLNTIGDVLESEVGATELFNVKDRQTANAAQALCDALDSQNIDDMYVKAAFIIAGKDESFVVNDIPSTIAQGETLTISGTATSAAGEYVTVEMISTAFAAVPKETVGSASFIALSTKVAEDGTWEVTFDTSNLNVDEYSLKVASENETWKNVKINVVEAAEKPDTPDTPDVPDTPDTPDTPTEPTTPGFGALAALAGLGAVAVLLLRRE